MIRKVTELEQKLLDKGYYLIEKGYCGKNSKFTDYYKYQKSNFVVLLDKHRMLIKNYYLDYATNEIDENILCGIKKEFSLLQQDIKDICNQLLEENE